MARDGGLAILVGWGPVIPGPSRRSDPSGRPGPGGTPVVIPRPLANDMNVAAMSR